MFHRLWTLIRKELQSLLRERQTRSLLFLPVLIQVTVFPFAATLDVTNATIAIYNEDNGPASIELTQRIASARTFSQVLTLHSAQSITPTIENQKALLLVRFPPQFSRELANGSSTSLQVILDGRRSNSAQIAANDIQQIVQDYEQELYAGQTRSNVSQLVVRNWYNPNLNYKWFVVPSLIVATFQATIVLLAGIFAYQIPFAGSLLLFYASMLLYGLSLVGFGLLISSVCATQQQAFIGVFVFLMPAILLSGYVSPVENIPQWLQHLTWVNPIRHFTDITKQIYLKDADFSVIWHSLWPLLAITATTGSVAYGMFRRNIA